MVSQIIKKYTASFEAILSSDKFSTVEIINTIEALLKKEFGTDNVEFKRIYVNAIGEE